MTNNFIFFIAIEQFRFNRSTHHRDACFLRNRVGNLVEHYHLRRLGYIISDGCFDCWHVKVDRGAVISCFDRESIRVILQLQFNIFCDDQETVKGPALRQVVRLDFKTANRVIRFEQGWNRTVGDCLIEVLVGLITHVWYLVDQFQLIRHLLVLTSFRLECILREG